MPAGAARVRRVPATVGQPALAGSGDRIELETDIWRQPFTRTYGAASVWVTKAGLYHEIGVSCMYLTVDRDAPAAGGTCTLGIQFRVYVG
jgi:hypothetical protein